MQSTKQHSSRGGVGSFVVVAAFVAIAVAIMLNAQLLFDTVRYYQYHPDASMQAFAADTGMNGQGTFLFYTSQPSLENAAAFNEKCGKTEATTAVLGCYNGQNIYIYNVTDARITNVRDVTAAHEMLHAAYKRLNNGDKQKIDQLLEAEYAVLKDDKSLADRMAFYDRTEPGERDNELHSVIGTEIKDISPELEAYYKRYFSDRSKVVALHAQYSSVFTSLQKQADDLTSQIATLAASIKDKSASYNGEVSAVEAAIRSFNTRAQQGDFKSQAQFSTERQTLVSRTTTLETMRVEINSLVAEYNERVSELNSIATQTEELNHSLDSTLAPAPSL